MGCRAPPRQTRQEVAHGDTARCLRAADLRSSANTGCRAEKKYYLANLPAQTDSRTLAATIKARWICEQAHQQLKEELGL
jgi:hypothetical protein